MQPIKFNQLVISLITVGFILLIAYFCSQLFLHEQKAVDGGLILSKKIIYPDNFSPLVDWILGAWTSTYQLSALLFKLNWSILNVSKFFIFIVALFYLLGVMSVTYAFTKSGVIAFFVSISILIFQKNFGDADYPTLFFSPDTFGSLSLALTTCVFGFVFLGYFFWVGFLSIFLICIHPVVGLWTSLIIFLSVIFIKFIVKEELDIKSLTYGAITGAFVTAVSFFVYLNENYFPSSNIDFEALNNYYKYWEGHRVQKDFHLEYLFKTLGLFILSIFSLIKLKKYLKKNVRFGIWSVLISIFFSILIYVTYKTINFPLWLTKIMPSRFIIMHSVIGWPLILGILFVMINKYSEEKKISQYLAPFTIIFIVLFYSVQHYKTLLSLKNSYINNIEYQNVLLEKNHFWNTVKNTKFEGYILTNASSGYTILRKSLKPILINPGDLDGVPYFPKTADRLAIIIEEIYGISFTNPPSEIRNSASISDGIIKLNFEKYSKEKWQQLSRDFNIGSVIVPVNWNINLAPFAKNNEFAFYII